MPFSKNLLFFITICSVLCNVQSAIKNSFIKKNEIFTQTKIRVNKFRIEDGRCPEAKTLKQKMKELKLKQLLDKLNTKRGIKNQSNNKKKSVINKKQELKDENLFYIASKSDSNEHEIKNNENDVEDRIRDSYFQPIVVANDVDENKKKSILRNTEVKRKIIVKKINKKIKKAKTIILKINKPKVVKKAHIEKRKEIVKKAKNEVIIPNKKAYVHKKKNNLKRKSTKKVQKHKILINKNHKKKIQKKVIIKKNKFDDLFDLNDDELEALDHQLKRKLKENKKIKMKPIKPKPLTVSHKTIKKSKENKKPKSLKKIKPRKAKKHVIKKKIKTFKAIKHLRSKSHQKSLKKIPTKTLNLPEKIVLKSERKQTHKIKITKKLKKLKIKKNSKSGSKIKKNIKKLKTLNRNTKKLDRKIKMPLLRSSYYRRKGTLRKKIKAIRKKNIKTEKSQIPFYLKGETQIKINQKPKKLKSIAYHNEKNFLIPHSVVKISIIHHNHFYSNDVKTVKSKEKSNINFKKFFNPEYHEEKKNCIFDPEATEVTLPKSKNRYKILNRDIAKFEKKEEFNPTYLKKFKKQKTDQSCLSGNDNSITLDNQQSNKRRNLDQGYKLPIFNPVIEDSYYKSKILDDNVPDFTKNLSS